MVARIVLAFFVGSRHRMGILIEMGQNFVGLGSASILVLNALSQKTAMNEPALRGSSGRSPFRAANTVAMLKRVCEDTPRPIQDVIPETPDWLCAIIERILEGQISKNF